MGEDGAGGVEVDSPSTGTVVVSPQPGGAAAVTVTQDGNGKRAGRLDWLLGGIMGCCLIGAMILTGMAAIYHPEAGNWQLVNDTRVALFSFAEKIMIGYFALAMPKLSGK